MFGTNPYGIQYDGQVIREGQGGFRGAGGFNLNWDGDWEVSRCHHTQRMDRRVRHSLSAPCAIRGVDDQVWGLNFQRNIRRRNENAFWSPLPRQFNIYRLSMAGTMVGFEGTRASATSR